MRGKNPGVFRNTFLILQKNIISRFERNDSMQSSVEKDANLAEESVISSETSPTQVSVSSSTLEELVVKSKNQLKREMKSAVFMTNKAERRIAEKARRKAKRAAESAAFRLDPSLRDSRKNTTLFAVDSVTDTIISVPRYKHTQRHPKEKLTEVFSDPKTPTVVLDCRFGPLMTNRELNSLDKQLSICYGSTCRAFQPCKIALTGIKPGSATDEKFTKHIGVENWYWSRHEADVEDVFSEQKDRLVYLTAESENELEDLDPNDIYIIGGIVDHNRLKGLTHSIATDKGLRTARLPLQKYMSSGSRVVLTIVSVFDILLAKKVMSWGDAFKAMLPLRWSWQPITEAGKNTTEDTKENDSEQDDDDNYEHNQAGEDEETQ